MSIIGFPSAKAAPTGSLIWFFYTRTAIVNCMLLV